MSPSGTNGRAYRAAMSAAEGRADALQRASTSASDPKQTSLTGADGACLTVDAIPLSLTDWSDSPPIDGQDNWFLAF